MKLDHATIITRNLEAARSFLCSIIGLSEGPRPPFGVSGYWLYANGQPVVHLLEADTTPSARLMRPTAPRIDHVGLRVNTTQEWSALLERIRLSGVPYELSEVPLAGERQLFVAMEPGIVIEMVIDRQPGRRQDV
jgi:catechol 2,3-dioxygenase-like lactoylglutathione lyase family enzyme